MGKNVAVFVDVANIFYAAKAAGVDIDYVTLLKAATAGRDFVRAYAYTGLDPDNENQRNFHSFLARHGYKVVSKDIRKYGDGKVKANLDIELVVDMMKTARNLDVAIVVSGDGDFAPAIRAVQEMGVRVEVISFRGNTSSDLIDVADIFTDITQLAKVERGSSRSGRRVAEEEFDMTGTEIPDKQTEGSSQRQRRTRGRARSGDELAPSRTRETEEVAAVGRRAAADADGRPMTVLPGERLSRAGRAADGEIDEAIEAADFEAADEGAVAAFGDAAQPFAGDEPRRRRRRGGRGRGRGRGRAEDGLEVGTDAAAGGDEPAAEAVPQERLERQPDRAPRPDRGFRPERRPVEEEPAAARGPRPTPFGSIWDSQLGMPTGPAISSGPISEIEEDLEEPEIPEYLLAERRRGSQGQAGGRGRSQGGRGVRSGYSAAVDRERYGRGGLNRYGEPSRPPQPQSQPQGRPQGPRPPRRDERPPQQPVRAERPPRSDEPWSEVPPEIEEMLRAQMATRPAVGRPEARPRPQARPRPTSDLETAEAVGDALITAEIVETFAEADGEAATAAQASTTARGRGRRTGTGGAAATAASAAGAGSTDADASPRPRRGRPPKSATVEATVPDAEATSAEAPARGRGRRPAGSTAGEASEPVVASSHAAPDDAPKPKRGRPPKSATSAAATSTTADDPAPAELPAPAARGRRPRSAAAADDAPTASAADDAPSATATPAKRSRTSRGSTSAD